MTDLTCKYCRYEFKFKKGFDNHQCEQMKRLEFLETPRGKAAYHYYKEWLKESRGMVNVTSDTFLHSKYFGAFVRFINFSNRMMLPSRPAFIKYMVSLNLLPVHWCNDDVYINYIENLDKTYTPLMQAEETVKTLQELANGFECKPVEVFDNLEVGDCIKLLKARRLSPWVLLFSKKFHEFLAVRLSKEQRLLLQASIDPTMWRQKFKNRPLDVEKMKTIVKELGL